MTGYVIALGLTDNAKSILSKKDISVIEFAPNGSVMPEISGHADISFFYAGDRQLFIAHEMKNMVDYFSSLGFDVIVLPENMGREYPFDVPLNCVTVGNHLICNIDTVSYSVLKCFEDRRYDIINVRQGYAKCSVIPVATDALITDDISIARECINRGIDVLSVSKGSVKLNGLPYGFIGGTCGKISDDIIAFNGDLNTHDDGEKIQTFLSRYGVSHVSLNTGELIDIGSIITLF